MAEMEYRRAEKPDRDSIQALLERVDPGDWVLEALDHVLQLEPGGLYVAQSEGDPMAVSLMSFPREGEASFSAMRVDPEVRRSGVATEFTRFLVEEAGRLGAGVCRLLVEHDNAASHGLVKKAGFEQVDEWRVFTGLDLGYDQPASGVGQTGLRNMSQARMYFSRNMKATNPAGLIASPEVPWELHSMDWRYLQDLVKSRQLALRHGSDGTEGALILGSDAHRKPKTLVIRYLDGEKPARENLLRYLTLQAQDLEADVAASLPEAQALGLIDLLSEEPDHFRFSVYQRGIDQGEV